MFQNCFWKLRTSLFTYLTLIAFIVFVLQSQFKISNEVEKYDLNLINRIQLAERNWKESVKRRKKVVAGKSLESIDEWQLEPGMYLWDYFTPSFTCPYDVQRVGTIGDGGKWICHFSSFEKALPHNGRSPCTVYSFGVRDDSSFEEEIIDRTHCQIFAYDYSVKSMASERMQNEKRVKFRALGLAKENKGSFKSLKTLMKEDHVDFIDILKVDIEGGEFEVFSHLLETEFPDSLPFGQLLIEIHVDAKGSFPTIYKWWEKLEKRGLRPFFTETNHNPCVRGLKPLAVEYSFINKEYLFK